MSAGVIKPECDGRKRRDQATSIKYNRRSVSGITNPWLIVEVLSESTRDFDLSKNFQITNKFHLSNKSSS